MKSILILEWELELPTALSRSLLQLLCKEGCEAISVLHVLRPGEVARYCSSAISEYRKRAVDDNEINLFPDLHPEADLGEGCVPVGR